MAKSADNSNTTWISWREAVERVGSAEALLICLRERPILGRHQGLYHCTNGRKRNEPGEIDWNWWATADIDPVAERRVIFRLPPLVRMFWTDDPVKPADDPVSEVFAIGIELERGSLEALACTVAPMQPHVPTPAQPGRQVRRVLEALKILYPPDGKVSDDISIESVRGRVAEELAADSKIRELATPLWDTVNRALGRK